MKIVERLSEEDNIESDLLRSGWKVAQKYIYIQDNPYSLNTYERAP